MTVYHAQRLYFRKAYVSGVHGWPVEGATPGVARLAARLGPGRGRRALDLGCGEGRHSLHLAGRGWRVTGVDLEPLALAKARRAARRARLAVRFEPGDALNLSYPDGRFDLVLDYGCFHHVLVADWPRYRRGIARLLAPGGRLLLSVFSMKFRHHPGERRTRNWLVHRGHYDHFFTLREIRRALGETFDLSAHLEEHEGLNGFHHVLLRKKGAHVAGEIEP
jgi:SAM-dependent methyltransferase